MRAPRRPSSGRRRVSRVIPPDLHAAVLERLRQNDPTTGKLYGYRAVASWLEAEHQVVCSHMAVARLHAAASEDGERLLVAALREDLRDMVAPMRADLARGVKALREALKTETNTQKIAAGVRALTGALDTVSKLSGVAKPISVDVTSGGQSLPDAYGLLAASLTRLAQEPDAPGAGEAPEEPPAGDG